MKTTLHTKVDKDTKEKAQKLAAELGVPLSLVLNESLKRFVREKRVVFEAEGELRPEVGKALLKASEDYREGKNISPAFSSAEEMDDYLKSA